ncbi:MAG: carboxypeptidase-like regulatory domain-containing protein [Bryobacteraceae bacterium]|nr:carboxypeptidase-like regulatory domain-containing protein [Bryobacteraceae bacterium]
MKKKRKKTRIGSSLLLLLSVAVAAAAPPPQALIAGTVFREPGFALPGAEVIVDPDANRPKKIKVRKAVLRSDARGEWAVRVPAERLRYTVTVNAPGFASVTRQVEIQGEERVDVYVELKAEPAKPKA